MEEIVINTNLFYEELNSTCNPETLLSIARRDICLYEPLYKYDKIKNHIYIIDISCITNQHFMIFNDNQYERFKYFLINSDNYKFISKIIINEYFMKKIVNEKDHNIKCLFVSKMSKYYGNKAMDYIIKYLLKYKYITNSFHNIFAKYEYNIFYDFMEYFYFDNVNYYFNSKFNYDNFKEIVFNFIIEDFWGYDINLLEYCLNISRKNKVLMPQNFNPLIKFGSYIPINMLKKYVKIFEPNKLKFIILDDLEEKQYYEEIINLICSDSCFYYTLLYKDSKLKLGSVSRVLKKYNIDPEKIKNYKIQNISGNKKFSFDFIKNKNIDKKYKDIKYLPENIFPFTKKLFSTSDKLDLILQDSNYLLNLNINLINFKFIEKESCKLYQFEFYLLTLIYIISLLHNKKNSLLIYTLLLYDGMNRKVKIKDNKLVSLRKGYGFEYTLLKLLIDIIKIDDKYDFTNYVNIEIELD